MKATFTFAISLARFATRHTHILSQLRNKVRDRYEVVGVDGGDIVLAELLATEALSGGMSRGQAGCALSHLGAYRRMEELRLPHAFIIEDDALLPDNIETIVDSCLPYLSPRGVISFYSPRPRPSEYTSRKAPVVPSGQLLAPTARLDTHTATAYLIGAEAAKAIISEQSPVKHLADHWFAFHAAGAIDQVLLHNPMPVSVAHFDSSIGYDKGFRMALKSLVFALPPIRSVLRSKRKAMERRQKANIMVVDAPTFYENEKS